MAHLAKDLEPCSVSRRVDGSAVVTTGDGTSFELTVAVDRRKLMTLQETSAHVWGSSVTGPGRTTILIQHTGHVRRTGLRGKLRGPADDEAAKLCELLLTDRRLADACRPLDFTRFEVVAVDGRWRADLRLMGGSHVRTRLPPGGSYVRLAPDQVRSLLATVAALQDLFSEQCPLGGTPTSDSGVAVRGDDALHADSGLRAESGLQDGSGLRDDGALRDDAAPRSAPVTRQNTSHVPRRPSR